MARSYFEQRAWTVDTKFGLTRGTKQTEQKKTMASGQRCGQRRDDDGRGDWTIAFRDSGQCVGWFLCGGGDWHNNDTNAGQWAMWSETHNSQLETHTHTYTHIVTDVA